MKEFEGEKFRIETKINAEQKIETKFFGRVLLKPGQHMFSYDPRNNKLEKVILRQTQFEQGVKPVQEIAPQHYTNEHGQACVKDTFTIYMPDSKHVDMIHSKASYDPNKLYEVAINERNASRKFAKTLQRMVKAKPKDRQMEIKKQLEEVISIAEQTTK